MLWLNSPSNNFGLYLQSSVTTSFDSKENAATSHPASLEIDLSADSTNFTGTLAGDVSGTQKATVVDKVGTSTAANVHSAELAANAATNANTASTIVKRDGSGNFTAGTITGSLSGNATTATTADNVTGTVALANGGTGAITANAAFNALAPNQTGNSGKVLSTDGTNTAWTTASSGLQWQVVSGTSQQMASNTGYYTTNAALTLPASPAVGDVVKVAGSGAGGFRLAQNANQWVFGIPSSAGISWTARDSSQNWRYVASSAALELLYVGSNFVTTSQQGTLYAY